MPSLAAPAAAAACDPDAVPPWRRQLRLMRPLVYVVLLLAALASVGLEMMAISHGMFLAQSHWSRSLKDGVQLLDQYGHSCDPLYYRRYLSAMAPAQALDEGRRLLEGDSPDLDAVALAFRRGGLQGSNLAVRVHLFHLGRHAPLMAQLNHTWVEASRLLHQIDAHATALDSHVRSRGCSDPGARQQIMREVVWLNERLSPMQQEMVLLLTSINGRWHLGLLVVVLCTSTALLLLGMRLARSRVQADATAAQAVHAELALRRRATALLRRTLRALAGADAAPAPVHTVAQDAGMDDIQREVETLAARQRADHAALQAIFARSPDAFIAFDAGNRAVQLSPAFERLTGLPPAALLGRTESEVLAQLRALDPAASGAVPLPQGDARPWLLELPGLAPRTLELTSFASTVEGQPTVLCLRDVTRARALDRLKGEFMSVAAHELRTPMASIFGFVELLRHRAMGEARRTELLDIVHRQARQMIGILDDLLDLSRLEARGHADLHCSAVDLGQLVRQAAAGFACPAGRETPQLVPADLPGPVWADPDKLVRVLNNLLSNAYKYSPDGGAVVVQLHAGQAADGSPQVGLSVQDQGLGMRPEQVQRVGERFYRADGSGHIPGTGLGVSLVREILQLHGGTLQIESELGVGSRFTAWLPAAALPGQTTAP